MTWNEMYFHLPLYFVVVAPKLPSTKQKEENYLVDSTHEYYKVVCHAKETNKRKAPPPHSYKPHYRRNFSFHHLHYCRKIFSKLHNFTEPNTVKSHLSLQPPHIKISNKYTELQRNSTRCRIAANSITPTINLFCI
jgi:hypothetical protein